MVDDPLPCAVIKPLLLTIRTPTLSDRQFAQLDVMFSEVPFENVPVAVVCAVSPLNVSVAAFPLKVTDWRVGVTGDGVGVDPGGVGALGEGDLLPQAEIQATRATDRRTRIADITSTRVAGPGGSVCAQLHTGSVKILRTCPRLSL